MSVAAFLADLRRRDVRIRVEGDRLHCDAPSGVLTPELREQLRSRKSDVLEFLRAAQSLARQERALVPLQQRGERAPVFAVPGHNGDVFCYRALAHYLGEERPFYGLESPGVDGVGAPLTRIEDLAAYFAAQIHAARGERPCILAGYCAGGTVALELARQLQQRGTPVRYLALFACPFPTWFRRTVQWRWRVAALLRRIAMHARALAMRSPAGCRDYLRERMRTRRARLAEEAAPVEDPVLLRREVVAQATVKAVRAYAPRFYAGRLGLFLPVGDPVLADAARRWRRIADRVDEYFASPGANGFNLLREPHAFATAELLRRALEAADPP